MFVAVYSISKLETYFYDRIRLCAANDSLYVKWMGQVQDGTMRRYRIEDDLLYFKGGEDHCTKSGWVVQRLNERGA